MKKDEEKKDDLLDSGGLATKMLQTRTIIISQQVNSELTQKVLGQILLLEQEDPEAPVTVFINSPGGEMFSGYAIFDTLRFISCPITTIVAGFAASMGSILSLAADKGRRFAMPQAKILIHQPLLMGYQGRAADCEIQAREILKTREHLINLYCEYTGRNYDEIKQAIDRDNWFTAEEALDFGLLDRVIQSRAELNS
ncbi:MAG: ATP-dependent Clp protease proteolytic subunit [Deltaproteobacteria bacterium]|nr:ATP-dependent Clp protease proteolytic subunit [Deltaproteobacteria bacterium]